MSTPRLLPGDALEEVRVAVSVSESADLRRLGLTERHAELAVGELARAVLVSGGRIVYGGRIRPSGFTEYFLHEVDRYGGEGSFTLCLAYPEHRKLALSEIREFDSGLGVLGEVVYLDPDGQWMDPETDRGEAGKEVDDQAVLAESYSGLREFMARISDARVIVGGQLEGYSGRMPGIIEEAIVTVRHGHPLCVAGGFGGAAAAVAKTLGADLSWAPNWMPLRDPTDTATEEALGALRQHVDDDPSSLENGLTDEELAQLSSSHRPGEIATFVVRGLSRVSGSTEARDS